MNNDNQKIQRPILSLSDLERLWWGVPGRLINSFVVHVKPPVLPDHNKIALELKKSPLGEQQKSIAPGEFFSALSGGKDIGPA